MKVVFFLQPIKKRGKKNLDRLLLWIHGLGNTLKNFTLFSLTLLFFFTARTNSVPLYKCSLVHF